MHNSWNTGIDILRIVSMVMVLLMHFLTIGGIMQQDADIYTSNALLCNILNTASYGAVNIFVLITGYNGIHRGKSLHLERIVAQWMSVVFYSLVFYFASLLFSWNTFSIRELISSFFPVINVSYWFFTQYCALYLLSPFLNDYILKTKSEQLQKLIYINIFLFCILPTVSRTDLFGTVDGYRILWFVVLYIIGGTLAKYQSGFWAKKWLLLGIYCMCVVFTMAFMYIMPLIGLGEYQKILLSYTSPTILLGAISLMLFFLKYDIKDSCGLKIRGRLKRISKHIFSIYLIHMNLNIRNNLLEGAFINWRELETWRLFICLVVVIIVCFIICIMIDIFRDFIFRILGLDKIGRYIEMLFIRIYTEINNNISVYLFRNKR